MSYGARPEGGGTSVASGLTLTDNSLLGLFFIQRYRFLTVSQFARVVGMHADTAYKQLRALELHRILGHFGNISIPGHGGVPKVYFLTRKGFEMLSRESDIPPEMIGSYKEVHVEARWSPQMYHRLRIVDLMTAVEVAVRGKPHLSMVQTFLEYRRVKRGTRIARETTDYIDDPIPENRIVPDAAFVLENLDRGKRGLFFLEMDMGTERIVSSIISDARITLRHKIERYDRYLRSGRFVETYARWGTFGFFTLLFVTQTDERVENIRREVADLPQDLAQYYRFTTFERAMADFLGPVWKSRASRDTNLYPLVR